MIWPLGDRRPLPIGPDAWRDLVTDLPFFAGLDEPERVRLLELCAAFLSTKSVTGVQGIEPDDRMRLSIAAQACLPVLNLGLSLYDDFVEIVVYPSAFEVRRTVVDRDGVVHEFDDVLDGEAMDGGPVVLAWDSVSDSEAGSGSNVVVHEFAHKIDLADGDADGCPPMPISRRRVWLAVLEAAFDDFVVQLEDLEAGIPPHVDPESYEAGAWFDRLALDPYAATDEAEFFAVAAECFFTDPHGLCDAFPALYAQFVAYFGQDPRARFESPGRHVRPL
jgi:Mlc titration factor MtfA (ptsG expression regulator)